MWMSRNLILHPLELKPIDMNIDNNNEYDNAETIAELSLERAPPSMVTEAEHLNQERQHLQSTSTNKDIQERMKNLIQEALKGQHFKQTLEDDMHKDAFPPSDLPNIKTRQLIFSVIQSSHSGIGYTDLTGRFPFRSSRGNEYILIGYHHDVNAILAEPLKNRQAEIITQVSWIMRLPIISRWHYLKRISRTNWSRLTATEPT